MKCLPLRYRSGRHCCLNLTVAGWGVQRRADGLLSGAATTSEDAARINSLLVNQRLEVFHLALAQASLEDIFLRHDRRKESRLMSLFRVLYAERSTWPSSS